jgi:hypothetical protein
MRQQAERGSHSVRSEGVAKALPRLEESTRLPGGLISYTVTITAWATPKTTPAGDVLGRPHPPQHRHLSKPLPLLLTLALVEQLRGGRTRRYYVDGDVPGAEFFGEGVPELLDGLLGGDVGRIPRQHQGRWWTRTR